MSNMIHEVSNAIIAGIALMAISFVVRIMLPDNAIIKMAKERKVFTIFRYITAALLTLLCGLLVTFNKWFVVSVVLLVAFMVLMICYDYLLHYTIKMLKVVEEARYENNRLQWPEYKKFLLREIASCSSKAKREELIKKLEAVDDFLRES